MNYKPLLAIVEISLRTILRKSLQVLVTTTSTGHLSQNHTGHDEVSQVSLKLATQLNKEVLASTLFFDMLQNCGITELPMRK